MTRTRLQAVALAALLGAASPASAQDLMPVCSGGSDIGLSVGPTFNSAPTFADRFGLKAGVNACATGVNEWFGQEGWHGFAIAGRALIPFGDSVETADQSEARVTLRYGLTMYSVNDDVMDNVDDTSAVPTPGGLVTSYGFLEIGGTAAYEESIDRSERGFTGGVVARYGHERISWIPSLSVKYEFVAPTHSEARRAAGLDEKDRHRRFSADAYLNVNLGFVSATLDGLGVAGEASWFKSSGLDPQLLQRSDGWESGWHCAGTVRWTRPIGIARNVSVSQIYLRYGSGRLGTGATNEEGFRAGVDVAVGG